MALAKLNSWMYEAASTTNEEKPSPLEYQMHMIGQSEAKAVCFDHKSSRYRENGLQLTRVYLQSQRNVTEAKPRSSNRPTIPIWIVVAIDGFLLLSLAFVIAGFFVFLLELSAGRLAFLAPSFSAFFIFSLVSMVVWRLKRSIRKMQSAALPQ